MRGKGTARTGVFLHVPKAQEDNRMKKKTTHAKKTKGQNGCRDGGRSNTGNIAWEKNVRDGCATKEERTPRNRRWSE